MASARYVTCAFLFTCFPKHKSWIRAAPGVGKAVADSPAEGTPAGGSPAGGNHHLRSLHTRQGILGLHGMLIHQLLYDIPMSCSRDLLP